MNFLKESFLTQKVPLNLLGEVKHWVWGREVLVHHPLIILGKQNLSLGKGSF